MNLRSKNSKDTSSSNKKTSRQASLPPIARRIDHNPEVEGRQLSNGPKKYPPKFTESNHIQSSDRHNHVNEVRIPNGTHSRPPNNTHFNDIKYGSESSNRLDSSTSIDDNGIDKRLNHNKFHDSNHINRLEGDSKPMIQRAQEQQLVRDQQRLFQQQYREKQIEQQREFLRRQKASNHPPYRDMTNGRDRNGRIGSGSSSSSALSQPTAVNSPPRVSNGQSNPSFSSYREKSSANDQVHGQKLRHSLNPSSIQSPWRPPDHIAASYHSGQTNATPEVMERANYPRKMPRDSNNFAFRQRPDERKSIKNNMEMSRPTQV